MPKLEVRNLTAGYGDSIILEDITFELDDGKGLAILGRNGVGKSSLILSLMGLTRIKNGEIIWDGEFITEDPTYEISKKKISWVPQERNIFSSLTVEENLLVASSKGYFDINKIYDIFPRLKERKSNPGDKLSGGEQQMLAIGRALMTNPRLIFLDEPFEGLAPVIVEELEKNIRSLLYEHGISLIIVEQKAEDAMRLSHDTIILDRGRIVVQGSSEILIQDMSFINQWISVG